MKLALGDIDELEQRNIDPDTGIPMDGNGRYLIPKPSDVRGKRASWQRASTLAGMLSDTHGLETWKRNVDIVGIGKRSDLRLMATTVKLTDRDVLRSIRDQAFDAGGGNVKANEGTGFHAISDLIDNGGTVDLGADLQQYAGMVNAYRNLLVREQMEMPAPEHRSLTGNPSELVVVHESLGVAGRFDKVRKVRGRNVIVDVKTGQDPMRYGELEYAVQLALYAHCPDLWHESIGAFEPMIPVDKEVAYVAHVPAQGDYAELIAVDIALGWRYLLLALEVRAARKVTGLLRPLGRVGALESWPAERGPIRQPGPIQASMMAAQANNLPVVAPQAAGAGIPAGPTPPVNIPAPVQVQAGQRVPAGEQLAPVQPYQATAAPRGPERLAQQLQAAAESVAAQPIVEPLGASSEQQAEQRAESGKKVRKCSRCKRPGHQARTCTYVVTLDGANIPDARTAELIAGGNAADAQNITPDGAVQVTAELQGGSADGEYPGPPRPESSPIPGATHCVCTTGFGPGSAGWTNRGDGIYVHAVCGLPSYATTMRANAASVAMAPGQDPSTAAMAVQAVEFFTAHPEYPPPANVLEQGWPPPLPDSARSNLEIGGPPATPAGATSTPAPASPPAASNPSPTSSPPPATPPGTAPPAMTAQPPIPPPASHSPSVTPASPSAVGSAAQPAAPGSDEPSWEDEVRAAADQQQLAAVMTAASAAGEMTQALTVLAGERMWTLRPGA